MPRNAASSPPTARSMELPEKNYKAIVQEYCQKHCLSMPVYATEYPDDAPGYVAVLTVNGNEYRSKPMPAKKKAEQDAAGRAALDIGLVTLEGGEDAGAEASLGSSRFATNGDSAPHPYSSPSSSVSSASFVGGGASIRSPLTSRFSARTAAVPESKY